MSLPLTLATPLPFHPYAPPCSHRCSPLTALLCRIPSWLETRHNQWCQKGGSRRRRGEWWTIGWAWNRWGSAREGQKAILWRCRRGWTHGGVGWGGGSECRCHPRKGQVGVPYELGGDGQCCWRGKSECRENNTPILIQSSNITKLTNNLDLV